MGDKCNCPIVSTSFSATLLGNWDKDWPFPVLWPLLGLPDSLTYWMQNPQFNSSIDLLVISMCKAVSCVVEKGYLLWPVHSFGRNSVSLCSTSFCSPRPNLPVTLDISWLPTFAFQSPMMNRTSFGGVSSRRSSRSSQNWSASSASMVGAQTWITVMLNGLPWKWTKIILSFLRLHPSTAIWTLLLVMRATPFLLWEWDSCPQ